MELTNRAECANLSGVETLQMEKHVSIDRYRPRVIDKTVEQYLETFGAVCIEGPKWCGKTWTASFHGNSEVMIGDPANNFQNRSLAEISPVLILDGETPRLIDEWQEVPSLWDAVRHVVDQRGLKGQFILTGSATPARKGIIHSGAGRIGKLRMRPMSLFESGDSTGSVSLQELCNGIIKPAMTGEVELGRLAQLIIRGGWPASIGLSDENAALLPEKYLAAVIDDDVFRIDGIKRDAGKMRLLLRSLARNESTTATNLTLKNDIREIDDTDIDIDTVAAYLDIFERLFLTDNQLPFDSNIRSSARIKKARKRHLADPSLACALLNATPQKLIGDLTTFGFMFEALCERDLKIYAESFGANLYHYQDYANRELDAVIELADGRWCAIEIKLGANKIDDAAANLTNLRDAIAEDGGVTPSVLCIICGMSNAAYQRPDGVFVVPFTALKD